MTPASLGIISGEILTYELCWLHADINCIQIFPPFPRNTVYLIHYEHTDTVDVTVLYMYNFIARLVLLISY